MNSTELIKSVRDKYNLTQTGLAELLGYKKGGQTVISLIESGKVYPKPWIVKSLEYFLKHGIGEDNV